MNATTQASWAGIDWGDKEHHVRIVRGDGDGIAAKVEHSPDGLAGLIALLRRAPDLAGVAVETPHGPLIAALLNQGFTVYAVNPKVAAKWRESWTVVPRKDDAFDAWSLAEGLRTHHARIQTLRPDDPDTRRLAMLCEDEQTLIQRRAARLCELKSVLKTYFPGILAWFSDLTSPLAVAFLERFSTPQTLADASAKKLYGFFKTHKAGLPPKRQELISARADALKWAADPIVVEARSRRALALAREIRLLTREMAEYRKEIERRFDAHPDAPIFRSLPGAGAKLAPRLLAHFGSDRSRHATSKPLEQLSGCAPVTRQSGRKKTVAFRWACRKSFRNTMFHYAFHATQRIGWAKLFYERARAAGQGHAQALRNLGQKLIRLIYRMWQTRSLYDEDQYLKSLARHGSPLAAETLTTCG